MSPQVLDKECGGTVSKGNVNNLRQESYNLVFMSQILRDVKRNMCDGSRLPGYLAELCKLLLDGPGGGKEGMAPPGAWHAWLR